MSSIKKVCPCLIQIWVDDIKCWKFSITCLEFPVVNQISSQDMGTYHHLYCKNGFLIVILLWNIMDMITVDNTFPHVCKCLCPWVSTKFLLEMIMLWVCSLYHVSCAHRIRVLCCLYCFCGDQCYIEFLFGLDSLKAFCLYKMSHFCPWEDHYWYSGSQGFVIDKIYPFLGYKVQTTHCSTHWSSACRHWWGSDMEMFFWITGHWSAVDSPHKEPLIQIFDFLF